VEEGKRDGWPCVKDRVGEGVGRGGSWTREVKQPYYCFCPQSSTHHVMSALASLQKGEKNSLVVSFKRPTPNSVEISSEMGIHGRTPILLDLSGNYALRHMKGQGKLTVEGKTYNANYTSDIQKGKYAKFTFNAIHPKRRIQALLEGGKDTEEAVKRGKVEVMWDADNDPSQKAGVTMELADKVNPNDINIGGMLEVFTPVKEYQHLKAELKFENSARRILTVAETVLGDKRKEYSTKFLLRRPITKDSFRAVAWLKTPHRLVRHVEVSTDHSFDDSGRLATSLKGTFNREFLDMGVSGSKKGDLVVRVLEGAAFFRSSIPGAQSFRLTFDHKDVNGRYTSQALLDVNGDEYAADMEADFRKVHVQVLSLQALLSSSFHCLLLAAQLFLLTGCCFHKILIVAGRVNERLKQVCE